MLWAIAKIKTKTKPNRTKLQTQINHKQTVNR